MIHSSSHNCVASVDVVGRGGYMSQTIHYPYDNPGGHGIFLGLSFYSCPVEKIMVIREVDIGVIPATLPIITDVGVVYCSVDQLIHTLLKKCPW